MSWASPALNFTLFVLNILCFLFAGFAISCNTFALGEFSGSDAIKSLCMWGIVSSSILIVNSILGCCSVTRKSINFYCAHSIIMILLVLAQITVMLFLPVDYNYIAHEFINSMWNLDMESDFKMTMYEIKSRCCGKFGPEDYTNNGLAIPLSCYRNNNSTDERNLFEEGCVNVLSREYIFYHKFEELFNWTGISIEAATALTAAMAAIDFKNTHRRNFFY